VIKSLYAFDTAHHVSTEEVGVIG